jgi:hypothetical protein
MSDQNSSQKTTQKDNIKTESLEEVMKDLEQKINPKTIQEGISRIAISSVTKDPSYLLVPMQNGAKEFEQRVGRPMTYSEMREMWG